MEVRLLERGEEDGWRDFVDGRPESLVGHRIEWRDVFRESLGHDVRYLTALDGGEIAGVLPLAIVPGLMSGKALVSLPWLDAAGPLARDEETALGLVRRAVEIGAEEGCGYVEIRALRRLPEPRPLKTAKVVMHLPLEDPDRMWKSFSAKVRNQIRKAEREGLSGETGGAELLPGFYDVFSRNMRDIGVPVWGIGFFEKMLGALRERSRVILVRRSGETVGGGILIVHNRTAVVPSASSLRSVFSLCPNHMLYWTALRTAREMGAELFDFGRSTPGSGTWRFKKQWGSVEKSCFWHYSLARGAAPPDNTTVSGKMKPAVWVWKRLPLFVTNRLGPVIVRRIP